MVSLQSNNLHFITHSTSSAYNHKILEGPEDGSTDTNNHWQPPDGWSSIPGMKDLTTEPVVCKWDTDFFVFGLDLDGRLKYNRYHDDGTGNPWIADNALDLGSKTDKWLSKPATVAAFPKYLELVILGNDRSLYQIWYNGTSWSPATRWFSTILFKEPPVVTTWGVNRMDVFCVAVDGRLYQSWWVNSDGWYPRNDLKFEDLSEEGKLLVTNQVQVIPRKDSFDLLVVGRDSKVYHRVYDNKTWEEWKVVPEAGFCRGIPELVSFDDDRVDAFVIGTDGWVRHLAYTDKDGWSSVDKKVLGPTNFDRPTAVSRTPGDIELAVISSYGGIRYRSYSTTDGWGLSEPGRINGSIQSRVGTAS